MTARQFIAGLEKAVADRRDPIEICRSTTRPAFQVWVRTADLLWIVGSRAEGRPYQPTVFGSEAEAVAVAETLLPYVWPAADAGLEYYFNTQLFSSSV